MRRADLATALLATALFAASPADACSVSATGVNFGTYDARGVAPLDGAGEIALSCHPSTHEPEIALGAGQSGSFLLRRMNNGTSHLDYNLYTSPARLFVWGDGTGGSTTLSAGEGNVSAGSRRFSATIYGRIPPGQIQVTPGSYGDTLFVTIIF